MVKVLIGSKMAVGMRENGWTIYNKVMAFLTSPKQATSMKVNGYKEKNTVLVLNT